MCSIESLQRVGKIIPDYPSILRHEAHDLQLVNVDDGIAANRDQVGKPSGLDGTNAVPSPCISAALVVYVDRSRGGAGDYPRALSSHRRARSY